MTSFRLFIKCLMFTLVMGLLSSGTLLVDARAAFAEAERDELWRLLANRDADLAHAAMNKLIERQDDSVRFFEERMISPNLNKAAIERWIEQMDADDFQTRERASRELARLGAFAESTLMKAVQTTSSAEVRSRAGGLLNRLSRPVISDPDLLRTHRAVYVLEQIGTKSAMRLLKQISFAPHERKAEPPLVTALGPQRENPPPNPGDQSELPDGFKPYASYDCVDHKTRVFDVDFHPNGRNVASAGGRCDRGFVRAFDVKTGEEILEFETGLPAFCLAYSPDGKFLATGGGGLYEPGMAAVELWEAETGRRLRCFVGHTGAVYTIAFSPDGRWLLTGSQDGTMRLWDLPSGRELHQFLGHHDAVFDVALSPDGRYIASGGGRGHSANQPGELILWEIASGEPIEYLQGHDGPVFSVAFSPDGKTLASGGADKTVRLWSLQTRDEIGRLQGHKRHVHGVAFHPDTSHVAAVDMRGAIKIWDGNHRLVPDDQKTASGRLYRLAFSPDGRFLATAGPGLAVDLLRATGKNAIP